MGILNKGRDVGGVSTDTLTQQELTFILKCLQMKLDITEVYFLSQVTQNASIKASDATVVSDLMKKLDKEFARLQKLEQ